MRNILFIIILFVYSITLSQENSYSKKFTYNFQFKPKTNSSQQLSQEMTLLVNNTSSIYVSKQKQVLDSLREVYKDDLYNYLEEKKSVKPNFIEYVIYKNRAKKELVFTDKVMVDVFEYSEKLPAFNWKILESFKEILGYNCQKAITSFAGREYTAWFTQEIPISEGPYKFHGLPGLILDIKDSKNNFQFSLIGISNGFFTYKPQHSKNPIKINKEDEESFKEGAYRGVINRMLDESKNLIKKKIESRVKYKNNIELRSN